MQRYAVVFLVLTEHLPSKRETRDFGPGRPVFTGKVSLMSYLM